MPAPDTLVNASEFMKHLGIKKTKFYASIKNGKIPRPIKLTATRNAWPLSIVTQTIEQIKAGTLSL